MAEQVTKIDIFSGFLGAGKTTLIKKLIKEAFQGEKIVLIENEFGEIGIDGGFMREAGIQVNELNSGCICCSLVGDFREALKKVVETYHPDRILIEPSGVGKLSDVTRAVEGVGETLPVSLNSFVTVADVNKVKMYMKNFGEFYDDQISHASCIILSRTGSADEKKVAAAVALIQEKNPTATIVTTDWNELTGAQIVSVMDGKRDLVAELLSEAQASNAAHADEDRKSIITTTMTMMRTATSAATITTTMMMTTMMRMSITTIMTRMMTTATNAAITTTTMMTTMTMTSMSTTMTASAAAAIITIIMTTMQTKCSPAGATRLPTSTAMTSWRAS